MLAEPELQKASRLLYLDSDTIFLCPVATLFDRYCDADLYAREEPFCGRSSLGYDAAYLDEDRLVALCRSMNLARVPPFNTGVCLLNRKMADAITSIFPTYFDNLFRFLSRFYLNPTPRAHGNTSTEMIYDPRFRPDGEKALPYPSSNRWIVDQLAMWLALGQLENVKFGDFEMSDVWQGAEYHGAQPGTRLPTLCHYFSGNTQSLFQWLQRIRSRALRR